VRGQGVDQTVGQRKAVVAAGRKVVQEGRYLAVLLCDDVAQVGNRFLLDRRVAPG
jgi:hypothetical protein